jgi:hypothetical protein
MLVNALGMDRHHWIAHTPLARPLLEEVLRALGRRHLAHQERQDPARCQRRILFGLLHQARATSFARQHDFRRIRTTADFRRLVPLSSQADQRRTRLEYATASVLPAALDASYLQACHTALALADHHRPRRRPLAGTVLALDLPPLTRPRLPRLLRPFTQLLPVGPQPSDRQLEQAARLPLTTVVGPVHRLDELLRAVLQSTGKSCLQDVWPGLTLMLTVGDDPEEAQARLSPLAGDALLLTLVSSPQGPLAIAEPNTGLCRLLYDHGLYFELAADAADSSDCLQRWGIESIEVGQPGELVVTSPAGFWAWRTGKHLCFEPGRPLAFRFVPAPVPAPRAVPEAAPLTTPPLHPRSDGTPAAPPESFVRSPWSLLVDRE